jgi:hypothetical protein
MKGKMEITIGVSVGSSIQIAAGMIPILVLAAWPLGKNLTLYFADFEVSREGIAYISATVTNRTAALNIRPSCFSSLVRTSRSCRAKVREAEVCYRSQSCWSTSSSRTVGPTTSRVSSVRVPVKLSVASAPLLIHYPTLFSTVIALYLIIALAYFVSE